tara:strand:+ start:7617 stop:8612 length:996 start_codon:yes stop_codon:yes gene_type:complete
MPGPTLSVVMATHGHGGVLARSLGAICEQSRPPDEVVIVDDASTDRTREVLAEFQSRYDFLKITRNQRNLGAIPSLDRAFALASGDYLYGAASDDRVLPGTFELALESAREFPHAGLICGEVVRVDALGRNPIRLGFKAWDTRRFVSPADVRRDWLEAETAMHSVSTATIYRRASLEAAGGFPWDLHSWADTFAARTIALRDGLVFLPQPLAEWTYDPQSLSQQTRQDPHKLLDLARRAARAMESPQHRDLYPPDFVARWEAEFRQQVIEGYCDDVESASQALARARSVLKRGGPLAKLGSVAARLGVGALNLMLVTSVRSSLARYRGQAT